jgi:HEAT repeat protein
MTEGEKMKSRRMILLIAGICLLTSSAVLACMNDWDMTKAKERLQSGPAIERCSAAYYLGEFGTKECAPILIEALSDPHAHVRRVAAHALGKLQDERAVKPLIALLEDDSQPYHVRCAASTALGRLGDNEARPVLERAAEQSRGWLKRSAEAALARIDKMDVLAWAD